MRYGIIIPILWVILILDSIGRKVNLDNAVKFMPNMFKGIYAYLICTTIVLGLYYTINYLNIYNLKYLFKDIERNQTAIHIDGVWGATYDNDAYPSLIREEGTPIYTLYKDYFAKNPKTLNMWYDKIKNNNIYVIIDHYKNISEFDDLKIVKELKENDFEIEKIVDTYTADDIPYINTSSVWYLVKVKYIGE